jgi:hypothetical protein
MGRSGRGFRGQRRWQRQSISFLQSGSLHKARRRNLARGAFIITYLD